MQTELAGSGKREHENRDGNTWVEPPDQQPLESVNTRILKCEVLICSASQIWVVTVKLTKWRLTPLEVTKAYVE